MEKNTNDYRPIAIYICIEYGITFILGFVLGFIYGTEAIQKLTNMTGIITFIIYGILAIVFGWMYHQRLKEDAKRLTKKDILIIALGSIGWFILNIILTSLINYLEIPMENQEIIINTFSTSQILTIVAAVIFAPLVEELIFRYSISTFFKKNLPFIIVSSVIFGALHAVNLAIIEYILMGAAFAYVYVKTDKNVIASFIVHMFNNFAAVIMLLIAMK